MEMNEMDKLMSIFGFVHYGHFDYLEWSKWPKMDHPNGQSQNFFRHQESSCSLKIFKQVSVKNHVF